MDGKRTLPSEINRLPAPRVCESRIRTALVYNYEEVLAMPALRKTKPAADVSIEIPVLCKFWQEDDVWNGVAEDIPVAVFGANFEQAQSHMRDAILTHLDALQELNHLTETIKMLRKRSRERYWSEIDMPLNQTLMRMSATLYACWP
jgi:hypothetical protein